MSKISLTNLVNLQNENTATAAINSNNLILQNAVDNTLSRNGVSPNTMGASLDMNSNRIINLPEAISDSEPVTLDQMVDALVAAGNINIGGTVVPVSSVMQPVVNASTIASARVLLGFDIPASTTGKGIIYATDYGVVADGVTDDSAAMQAAFNAIGNFTINPHFTGGILVLPPGKINLGSTTITSNYAFEMYGVGKGFTQAALSIADQGPYIGATWFISSKTSGNVIEFHTKMPVTLHDFGIILPTAGTSTATGIYIEYLDPHFVESGLTNSTSCNFGSRIRDMSFKGGGTFCTLLNCAVFSIDNNYIEDNCVYGMHIINQYPVFDSGDDSIWGNFMQTGFVVGTVGILLETHSGLGIGPNNKILGYDISINYRASVANVPAGEINIHNNNMEACRTNALRVQQTATNAIVGGINFINNHVNGGTVVDQFQSAIVFVTNGSSNYITRGKIMGNDILYGYGAPGANVAMDIETGDGIIIANNSFSIPADGKRLNTGTLVSNLRYTDNGPVAGGAVSPFTITGTNIFIDDRNGIAFSNLPSNAMNGSLFYCTDGQATSTSNYFLIGGGSGVPTMRVRGNWYSTHPFVA